MDEIYQMVRQRMQKIEQYAKQIPDKEELRKFKEDEKFWTEKENWILNILKQIKDYSNEQKE